MTLGAKTMQDELARWEPRVADLKRRVAEQKRRVSSELKEGLGAREMLHFMEQTLENWREHVVRHRPRLLWLSMNAKATTSHRWRTEATSGLCHERRSGPCTASASPL